MKMFPSLFQLLHPKSYLLTCFALLSLSASAAEIFSGRLYTQPATPYVNQPFEIHFELEVTPGCEVEDLRINDFPNDTSVISVAQMQSLSSTRVTRNGEDHTLLHFSAAARGLTPLEQTYHPRLQCMLTERRSSGFFSHWQSYPAQSRLAPFTLRVKTLPEEGRPAAFSGAVGTFRLVGSVTPKTVRVGDIVTLTLDLTGTGWLGDAAPTPPPANRLFKIYPVKEALREPLRVRTEQVFIPISTNATSIAAATFTSFNPATERYETLTAGPFALTFLSGEAQKTDEVRVINTAMPATPATARATLFPTDRSLRPLAPLIAVASGALIGLLLFFMLTGRHTRAAVLVAALALGAGVAVGIRLNRHTAAATHTLAKRADLRFAPSQTAAILFSLNPGTPVIQVETVGEWARIDADGHRGWLPADTLQTPATTHGKP